MFSKGDKIVYPLYGAGIIEDIEEIENSEGVSQCYYVLHIPVGNLIIRIPASKAAALGIREIYPKDEILGIISGVTGVEANMPDNWNLRYKENMDRIKSGKLDEVSLVFRSLRDRERERGLSTAEKKMMTTAKQIIISEIILSHGLEKDAAENILTDIFGNPLADQIAAKAV